MKESNEHVDSTSHSVVGINYKNKLRATEINKIKRFASEKNAICHKEIRELTKIILKINPAEVDESLQAKFNQIMHKVKTQYS